MARGRLVRREEAEELLAVWERSGERMSDWCAARGLNWYSLNAFKGRWGGPATEIAFAEVVATSAAVQPSRTVYRVVVGELAVEVQDDFEDDTLVRLVRGGAVLSLQPRVRIFLATEPCDMRKSFRGLSGLVQEKLREDPLSGHVFAFVNRRRTMLKLLVHIQTGFAIYYVRLSRGTFQLPAIEEGQTQVTLDPATLTLILEGIELKGVKRRLRHRPCRPGPDES